MGRLEKFIKENRSQMDDLVPSEKLWVGVSAGVGKSLIFKSKLAWLKYFGFGASVVVVSVASYLYVSKNSDHKKPSHLNIAADSVKSELPKDTLAAVTETVAVAAFPVRERKYTIESNPGKPEPALKEEPVQEKAEVKNTEAVNEAPLAEEKMVHAKKETLGLDTIFSGIKSLSLNVICFNLNIESAPGNKVRLKSAIQPVNGEFEIKGKKMLIQYERSGTELKVTMKMKEKNANIDCIKDLDIDIEVPSDIEIKAATAFGNISAKKLSGASCDLMSASGNISVEDISSSLKVTNSFGNFKGQRLKGNISIRSASGNLELSDAEGEIEAISSFGKTEFVNVRGNVTCRTSSGKTSIKNCDGEFNLNNAYGDITFDHFKGSGNFTATSGNITGSEMNLTGDTRLVTNFGAINLKLDNPYSELSFDTKTSFGVIHIDKDGQKIHSDKNFKDSKGRILITAITQSGNQYYH
jgi:hypothetical protein